jgi:hypothetical protein
MSWNNVLKMNTAGYPTELNGVKVESLPAAQGLVHSFLHNDGQGGWTWQVADYSWLTGTPAVISGAANLVYATPNGASGNASLRALVAADIPALAYGDVVGPASAVNNDLAAFDTTTGKLIKDSGVLTSDAASAVSLKHTRSHSIVGTSDHTSSATPGKMLKADSNGLPIDASNTDTQVNAAVNASHAVMTLDTNAQKILSLSTQQLGTPTELANKVYAGPVSGGAAVPDWRQIIEADFDFSNITTANATAAKHGLLPALSGDPTQFLNGSGAFSTVTSGGGITIAGYIEQAFTAQTSVTVTHNLSVYPVVTILDGSKAIEIPYTITHTSKNAFTVTFSVAATGTIVVVGGAGGAGFAFSKTTEIDFGATPVESADFTITDADVTAASLITAQVAYVAPTGKELDELTMDVFDLRCSQGIGSFTLHARSLEGYVADKFKIVYCFNRT